MGEGQGLVAKIVKRELQVPRVEIAYPEVTGLLNRKVERRINRKIVRQVQRMVRDQGYKQDPTMQFWGDYQIMLNQKGLLSIKLQVYSYAKGAAHGLTVAKSLTFDLLTGRIYPLRALFLPHSGYVRRINQIVKEEMRVKEIPLIAEFDTIRPDQDYYLTNKGIVVYFQLYEYTPYAYGIPEFHIPYTAVRHLLDPRGPIGRLFGKHV